MAGPKGRDDLDRALDRALGGLAESELGIWPLQDQLEEVLAKIQVYRWGGRHKTGVLTDREINLLAAVHALEQMGGQMGEYELPSGTVVTWMSTPVDGSLSVDVSGDASITDLPEGTREFITRMDPDDQPQREAWLSENWRSNKWRREEATERVRADREAAARRRSRSPERTSTEERYDA